jgi:A/G-specific adenine glycosylase
VIEASAVDEERNAALGAWFLEHDRRLPWRRERSPYRVLVSEAMLQQTQAARVIPYFERFIAAFPTVTDLAVAPLADVLRLWSGLGYNRRARRLHEAAKRIAADGWPTDVDGLMKLPGVGPYTAAALGSLGFGLQVPAVDTNLKRVLSRWHGESLSGRALQIAAEGAMGSDAATWNEAMMDLGAALCRPRKPRCEACPVADWCAGPDTYTPPPTQPRFEGSRRQVRGAVIRTLTRGEATVAELLRGVELRQRDLEGILDDLESEGLIESSGPTYRLAT